MDKIPYLKWRYKNLSFRNIEVFPDKICLIVVHLSAYITSDSSTLALGVTGSLVIWGSSEMDGFPLWDDCNLGLGSLSPTLDRKDWRSFSMRSKAIWYASITSSLLSDRISFCNMTEMPMESSRNIRHDKYSGNLEIPDSYRLQQNDEVPVNILIYIYDRTEWKEIGYT